MPTGFIKRVAKQSGEKASKIDHEFKTIEKNAAKHGAINPWAVATAAVEKHHPGYKPKK